MAGKLKVWGGNGYSYLKRNRDCQPDFDGTTGHLVRMIICTTSKKRAVELLNEQGQHLSMYEFKNYWCETGNPFEIKAGMSNPEVLLVLALKRCYISETEIRAIQKERSWPRS